MSTKGILIRVNPDDESCPICSGTTVVQKSTHRNVITLEYGGFIAHETIRVCRTRCQHPSGVLATVRCGILSRLVPRGAIYGYDIEVFVGRARFLKNRQREEIRDEIFQTYGITLSNGEISNLTYRFVMHLAELHLIRQPALRKALENDGGYPLHFDATCEDGRGTLFVAYAGWRGWVLGAWKLATERSELITPCLHKVADGFGPPCSLMKDLGRAGRAAAETFLKERKLKIPNLSCHTHFLSDVGKDLLKDGHRRLWKLFQKFKVRPKLRALVRDLGKKLGTDIPALREEVIDWIKKEASEHELPQSGSGLATVRAIVQWVLDYERDGQHLGFPFEQPYLDLYKRARKARRAVDAYLRKIPSDKTVCRALHRLARALDPVVNGRQIVGTSKALLARVSIFEELRAVLRLKPKASEEEMSKLSPEESAAELRDIKKEVDKLKRSLRRRRPDRGPAQDIRKAIDLVLEHLKKYEKSLWGHVIELPESVGGGIRVVDRTNNCCENFFHGMKHHERRRSGRKNLASDFEALPAEAALAYNLIKSDYVGIVCGSLENLPEAFAAIDVAKHAKGLATPVSEQNPAEKEPRAEFASLPRADWKLIRSGLLGKRIEAAARSRAPHCDVASG